MQAIHYSSSSSGSSVRCPIIPDLSNRFNRFSAISHVQFVRSGDYKGFLHIVKPDLCLGLIQWIKRLSHELNMLEQTSLTYLT